jgi:hypothetical protein
MRYLEWALILAMQYYYRKRRLAHKHILKEEHVKIYKSRKEASEEISSVDTLISDLAAKTVKK